MQKEDWGFYGRTLELQQLQGILQRRRWFFVKIAGRRRIGKTTLVEQATKSVSGERPIFYAKIPDSAPMGVLSEINEQLETFKIDRTRFKAPANLFDLAKFIGALARAGYVVVLDEFQYFNRDKLREFCSFLQGEVDALNRDAASVPGGLIVLGSLYTELTTILEDKSAPLYSRVTDELQLTHLDISSILQMLAIHADIDPYRLLFLWTLFEGVPKFYRDCYERSILSGTRRAILKDAFFLSSSPLKAEADNWFLKELHGKYDFILQFIARNPGCSHADIAAYAKSVNSDAKDAMIGGYLTHLLDRYAMIEKRLPIFAEAGRSRKGRYYIRDNFACAWLSALKSAMSAINFRPLDELVAAADERLAGTEGRALERLVMNIYEERSKKAIGDFSVTSKITGYWDKSGTELDLVAINGPEKRIRIGTCKRNAARLITDLSDFDGHVARFLGAFEEYKNWKVERVAIAPKIPLDMRPRLQLAGYIPQDLEELTKDLIGK